ncbi:protein of unknown function (plasmid) [Pararobbsia alpina]
MIPPLRTSHPGFRQSPITHELEVKITSADIGAGRPTLSMAGRVTERLRRQILNSDMDRIALYCGIRTCSSSQPGRLHKSDPR